MIIVLFQKSVVQQNGQFSQKRENKHFHLVAMVTNFHSNHFFYIPDGSSRSIDQLTQVPNL